MDHGPSMVVKNFNHLNRLKKFMQVEIDVTCMHINIGWCGFYGFGDSKTAKFLFRIMVIKKFNRSESAQKKFMLVGIDVTCMHNDFGGHSLSGFGDTFTFKNGKISP